MSYSGYIARIKNVRKHTNADRLQVGECFGNYITVIKKLMMRIYSTNFPKAFVFMDSLLQIVSMRSKADLVD